MHTSRPMRRHTGTATAPGHLPAGPSTGGKRLLEAHGRDPGALEGLQKQILGRKAGFESLVDDAVRVVTMANGKALWRGEA